MKRDTLILVGAAGVALYLVKKAGSVQGAVQNIVQGAKEILSTTNTRFNNGWRYFDDGTAIDPFGRYYKGGQLIYTPPAVKRPTAATDEVFKAGTFDV